MIINKVQYNVSKAKAEMFANAILDFDKVERKNVHPELIKAEKYALISVLNELTADIEQYEKMKGIIK